MTSGSQSVEAPCNTVDKGIQDEKTSSGHFSIFIYGSKC